MEEMFPELPEKKRKILDEIFKNMTLMLSVRPDEKRELSETTNWKGYRFPHPLNPETGEKYFAEFKVEESTVFLFGYPKTGTNWFYEVISEILYGDNEKLKAISKNMPPELRVLEIGKPSKLGLYEHLALPRIFFSSHLPAGLVDFEKIKKAKAKIIIPIRNPKDQAVSWFHFSKNKLFNWDEISPDWPQFFQDYVQGKHRLISKTGEWYPEYLLSWYKYKDQNNVMFAHFEDMKKNPQVSIRTMAKFLDVELSDDRVSVIARDTSFDAMKKEQEMENSPIAKARVSLGLMRKGQVGAWKNTFTVTQSELMDKIIAEKLGDTDIKFRYE